MSNEFIKKNYHIITYIICYLSLLFGFFFGENTTSGPKMDFSHAWNGAMEFNENFLYTLLNFDKIENLTRISPVYLIIISLTNKVLNSIELTRFFLFFVITLCQLFFYRILKIIYYPDITSDKKVLLVLSCIIFVSPSFRANTIWPESAMFGMIFFLIGIYYFLKNQTNNNLINISLNIFFIALAAYIRPSFAVFAIFFFFCYLVQIKNLKTISSIILLNLILAFPALYYVFVLDIHFFNQGVKNIGLNFNYLNKISVVFSIIFFHTIPILFYKKFFLDNLKLKNNMMLFLATIVISYIFFIFFNYDLGMTGGGIFLHISNFIFENNIIFYLIIPCSVFFVLKLCIIDIKKNLFILVLIILSIPQFTVYHKYLDPLILILCLTLFNFNVSKNFFTLRNLGFMYGFYLAYLSINFINNYLIMSI